MLIPLNWDATDMARAVRSRALTPTELLEAILSRLDEANGTLNVVVTRMDEQARADASRIEEAAGDGTFAGVPFLVKELASVAGVRSSAGSRLLLNHIADRDSELIRRYRQAGLVIAGKTNTPEFGILGTTEPLAFGPTPNPWNLSRTAGGSSGGSAAAVAAGIVPMAHASDGGGSIRIPASCCGVFGLKPTRSRNPMAAAERDAAGLRCEHVITRSVRDSARALDATAGPYGGAGFLPSQERSFASCAERDPGRLRIGYTTTSPLGFDTDPECQDAVRHAAELCESIGHSVEEASPGFDSGALWEAFDLVWTAEIATWIDAAARELGPRFDERMLEPLSIALRQRGHGHSVAGFQCALEQFQVAAATAVDFHTRYDVWLTPTLGAPPVELGWFDQPPNDPMRAYRRDAEFCAFTPIANATGQPAMSVPLRWNDEGLPIGVQFVAAFTDESTLISLAGQLERACPWQERQPHYGLAASASTHGRIPDRATAVAESEYQR